MQFLLANSLTYATYWNKQLNNFKKLFAKLAQLIRINNYLEYLLIRIIRVYCIMVNIEYWIEIEFKAILQRLESTKQN